MNQLNKWRLKVTIIEEENDLNTLTLENLIISIQSHERDLDEDEP